MRRKRNAPRVLHLIDRAYVTATRKISKQFWFAPINSDARVTYHQVYMLACWTLERTWTTSNYNKQGSFIEFNISQFFSIVPFYTRRRAVHLAQTIRLSGSQRRCMLTSTSTSPNAKMARRRRTQLVGQGRAGAGAGPGGRKSRGRQIKGRPEPQDDTATACRDTGTLIRSNLSRLIPRSVLPFLTCLPTSCKGE